MDIDKCCIGFDNNGECNLCEKGLFIKNGSCVQNNIQGCIEKTIDGCVNCATGFNLKDNKCILLLNRCKTYGSDGSCQSC